MNKLAIAVAAFIALPTAANAVACRDAKGHFIKCPPAAVATHAPAATATHAVAAAHPVAHAAPARKAPCRDAKTGRFKKC